MSVGRPKNDGVGDMIDFASDMMTCVRRMIDFVARMEAGVGDTDPFASDMNAGVFRMIDFVGRTEPGVSDMTASVGRIGASVGRTTTSVGRMTASVGRMTASVGRTEACVSDMTACVRRMTACVGRMEACVGRMDGFAISMTRGVNHRILCVGRMEQSVGRRDDFVGDTEFAPAWWLGAVGAGLSREGRANRGVKPLLQKARLLSRSLPSRKNHAPLGPSERKLDLQGIGAERMSRLLCPELLRTRFWVVTCPRLFRSGR